MKFLIISAFTLWISGIQKINQLIIDYYFLIMTDLSLSLQLILPEFQTFPPRLKIHRASLFVTETTTKRLFFCILCGHWLFWISKLDFLNCANFIFLDEGWFGALFGILLRSERTVMVLLFLCSLFWVFISSSTIFGYLDFLRLIFMFIGFGIFFFLRLNHNVW